MDGEDLVIEEIPETSPEEKTVSDTEIIQVIDKKSNQFLTI